MSNENKFILNWPMPEIRCEAEPDRLVVTPDLGAIIETHTKSGLPPRPFLQPCESWDDLKVGDLVCVRLMSGGISKPVDHKWFPGEVVSIGRHYDTERAMVITGKRGPEARESTLVLNMDEPVSTRLFGVFKVLG